MIFLPKGVVKKEVGDPDTISRDYSEARKIVEEVSHFQFHQGTFDNNKFNKENCQILEAGRTVQCKVTGASGTILPKFNNSGTISDAGTQYEIPQSDHASNTHNVAPDSNLFEIPYNKGFTEIDDTSLSWVSDYPELVHIIFSFQYVRSGNVYYIREENALPYGADWGDAMWSKIRKNRLQVAVNVDGVNVVGSGPNGVSTSDSYRGTSYTARSLATSINTIQLLPAGSHTIKGMAALAPSASIVDNDGNVSRSTSYNRNSIMFNLAGINTDPFAAPTRLSGFAIGENCCIATRNMLVIRYARGKLLE